MDLRKQRTAGQYPLRRRNDKSGSNTRRKDPREDVSGSPLRSTGRQGATQQKKFGIFQSQAAQRMITSSDRDAQSRIEARHEELKRQIAMKERQLAEMTRNEPTGNRLRNRLRDQRQQQFTSGKSIMSEERSRGQSSRSPIQVRHQKQGGLRSTYTTRPQATSQIRQTQQNLSDTRDFQFNPTRQPRNQQHSPLRRSHGRASQNSRSKDRQYDNSRSKSNRGSTSPYQSQGRSPFRQTQQHMPAFQSSVYGTRQPPTIASQPQNYEYNSSPLRNSRSPPSKIIPQKIGVDPSVQPQMHRQTHDDDYIQDLMVYKGSLYKNRIQAMEVDNEQMQRRLNQVSLELQRVKQDREDLSNQLKNVQKQNQVIEEQTLIKDEVDMQNKVLQNDLEGQRDENDRLSRKLKEEQQTTNNTNDRLINTSAVSKNLHLENSNLNSNMQQVLRRLDEISRDKLHNSKELNLVNSELERLSREDHSVSKQNIDLESQIQKIISEKQQIHRNLESLTKQYDECVREITQARRNMDAGNDWQTKLIVTKIIVQNIESFQTSRKTMAYKELNSYSLFDKDCQQKLRSFSVVAMKLGHYKMKKSLDRWYDNCLKPLDTQFQNEDVAEKFGNDKIKARVFHAWQKYKQMKFDKYYVKNNSIERIWYLLNRGAKQEVKRAMTIWKERQAFDKHKLRKIKGVLRKRNNKNLTIAMNYWRAYSNVLNHHCRVHILHREFTQKVFLSQVFSQMKYVLRSDKRRRIRVLNQYVKAWQYYCRYNRHLMQANMASIQFCQVNSKYLMKNVFDALRVHCEQKKYSILHQAVEEDINVAIKDTDEFVLKKSEVFLRKNQMRAGNIVSAMLGKRLFAYFDQWRSVNKHYQRTMVSKVNDKLIKMYTNEMSSYFQRWKDQLNKKQRQMRQKIVMDLQIQNESFQNEALSNDKTLRFHSEKVSSIKRRLVDKTFRKLFFRKLAVALGRWKDICNFRGSREQRVMRVLIRGKRRKLKQAFDLYIHFYRRSQQHGRNVRGAAYMMDTLNQRQMRKIYNALCFYTKRQVTAKKYWTRIFTRMDHFMKKRAIKIWNENGHSKYQAELCFKQDELINHIEAKNAAICQFESFKLQQGGDIDMATLNRRKKAYRLIGNYFARFYTDVTTQKFRTWKENVQVQIHKEKIILRTVAHWRKAQLETCRHLFKKFNYGYSMKEKTDKMKLTIQEANLIRTKIQFEKEQAAKKYKEDTAIAQASFEAGDVLEKKYVHIMSVLERRSIEWQYASKKRYIFWSWRHAVKQQKAFLLCVKNVLEKSMQTKGLEYIKSYAKNEYHERRVHRMLKKFSARYYKINCNDSFTKWKNHQLNKVDDKKNEALQAVTEESAEFEAYVQRAKDQNVERCLKFFVENQKTNIWRAWINVVKQLKLTKAKTVEFQTQQVMLRKEAGMRRWRARYEKTKVCRARVNQLKQHFQFKYRRSAFLWLKNHYKQTKNFVVLLSNLERLFREKMLADSFKTTKSFAVSKGLVFGNRRHKGTEDLMSLVQQAYLKRLGANFQRYKQNCFKNAVRDGKLKKVYNKFCTARARDAFEWWKRKAELAQLVIDNHESGPVRAEHWEAEREIKNLKEFMRQEHYTEDEIEKTYNDISSKNEHLMKKYILRMKYFSDQNNKLLPIVWNRWREYVGIRKLIKYQFRMMANQTANVKADLQRAFKKWRNGPDQLARELWQLPLETLQDLGMKTTAQVTACGDQLEENQAVQNHLLIQRDEFLNFYVKSQVLAMALIKDRSEFAKMQSWSRWNWARRILNRNDLNKAIRDAAYIHANLKEKEAKLDAENKQLEGENKDLGQFTEDGKLIRANFEKTKAERDKIAAQIADTDDDYKELLEENERLKKDIAAVEEKLKTYKNPKFQDLKSMKVPKKVEEPVEPEMTEEQKKMEERFRKLGKLHQGAGIR